MANKKNFSKTLGVIGFMTMLLIPLSGVTATAASGIDDTLHVKKIIGISKETYEKSYDRLPLKLLTIEEIMKKWPPSNAGAAGVMPGMAGPGGGEKSTPAVYIDNGKYAASKSKTDVVTGGKIGDESASGVKIVSKDGNVGGVYVTGEGSNYTVSNADIELIADGHDLGGITAGAACDDHGTLTLRNVTITADGNSRNTVSATNNSTLKVYNSTLIGHDAPFDMSLSSDDPHFNAAKYLEIRGNSRTTIAMSNSYSYFYNSTIIADGWGALSTDAAGDFVHLEANNCKVRTIKSGYGAYADLMCHDFFNHCDFDVASMAIVVAGVGDATFSDTKAKCGTYFALMHCVTGSPTEVGTLNVTGGEIECESPVVMIRSHNADINFSKVKIATKSGIMIKSMVNPDSNATPTEGKKVYGIHATFKDMEADGDIIHEDPDRILSVNLTETTLKGAINGAYLTMDTASKWIATGDSKVTLIGDFDTRRIDAFKGVTITAVAGEEGTFSLASGGILVLKTVN